MPSLEKVIINTAHEIWKNCTNLTLKVRISRVDEMNSY